LLTFTRKGAVLTREDFVNAGVWDASSLEAGKGVIYRPKVVCIYGRYYMFINGGPQGDANVGGPNENIYVAVSDNPTKDWKVVKECLSAEYLYSADNYKICSDPDILIFDDYFYMFFWSNYGICVSRSRIDNFPISWEYLGSVCSGIRPLVIPTKDKLYLVVNTDNATKVKLYCAPLGQIK
jgi:hypothetical protein